MNEWMNEWMNQWMKECKEGMKCNDMKRHEITLQKTIIKWNNAVCQLCLPKVFRTHQWNRALAAVLVLCTFCWQRRSRPAGTQSLFKPEVTRSRPVALGNYLMLLMLLLLLLMMMMMMMMLADMTLRMLAMTIVRNSFVFQRNFLCYHIFKILCAHVCIYIYAYAYIIIYVYIYTYKYI